MIRGMASLQVGDRAPDFSLPSTRGEITLSKRLKDQDVLLVFYPGDDTPTCTAQLCDYRDNMAQFAEVGVDVLAINRQGLDSHERFATERELPFPILSDATGETCKAYGAVSLIGYVQRALVLVGRDGRVKWRKTDLPVFRRTAEELKSIFASLAASP